MEQHKVLMSQSLSIKIRVNLHVFNFVNDLDELYFWRICVAYRHIVSRIIIEVGNTHLVNCSETALCRYNYTVINM